MPAWSIIVVVICAVVLLVTGISSIFKSHSYLKAIGGSWKKLEENSWKGSKEDFLRYYNNAKQYKRSGVYIHKNLSNGKCYVGQSHNIFQRVKDELDGVATNKGCKALYQDYQNGYKFEITLIFKKKGYPNLHKMERAFINLHNAKTDGYNETYGNTEIGETVYE